MCVREREDDTPGERERERERSVCVCVLETHSVCIYSGGEEERVCVTYIHVPYPSFIAAVVVRLRRHDYQLFLNLATLDSASWQLCDDK